jgi:hypothetical protein
MADENVWACWCQILSTSVAMVTEMLQHKSGPSAAEVTGNDYKRCNQQVTDRTESLLSCCVSVVLQ